MAFDLEGLILVLYTYNNILYFVCSVMDTAHHTVKHNLINGKELMAAQHSSRSDFMLWVSLVTWNITEEKLPTQHHRCSSCDLCLTKTLLLPLGQPSPGKPPTGQATVRQSGLTFPGKHDLLWWAKGKYTQLTRDTNNQTAETEKETFGHGYF